MAILKLDFTEQEEAQDMIRILERDKGLKPAEAIDYSISLEHFETILEAGWGGIALSLWGHAEPERDWEKLEDPIVEIDLDDKKKILLEKIAAHEKVGIEVAAALFLIFTMEEIGYHI